MKKLLLVLLTTLLLLTGCGSNSNVNEEANTNKLVVSATLDPHSKILEFAKDILKNEYNIDLEIKVLDDYYIFNKALDANEVDANYFQHVPFFENEVKINGYKLVNVAGIHIEPFGFYSKNIKTIDELKDGAKIIISNSVADHGRILSILDKAGVIKLKDNVDIQTATIKDIESNPKNLEFVEVKPEILSLTYDNNEGDLVAINGNYAIQAGLNPMEDAILLEQADETNPYVNIVACKEGHENDEKIVKLVEVLKSDAVKQFVLDTYKGSVILSE